MLTVIKEVKSICFNSTGDLELERIYKVSSEGKYLFCRKNENLAG